MRISTDRAGIIRRPEANGIEGTQDSWRVVEPFIHGLPWDGCPRTAHPELSVGIVAPDSWGGPAESSRASQHQGPVAGSPDKSEAVPSSPAPESNPRVLRLAAKPQVAFRLAGLHGGYGGHLDGGFPNAVVPAGLVNPADAGPDLLHQLHAVSILKSNGFRGTLSLSRSTSRIPAGSPPGVTISTRSWKIKPARWLCCDNRGEQWR